MRTVFFVQCGLLLVQLLCYGGTQLVTRRPRTVGGRLDARIPLVPPFIFVYLSWFPMLLGIPFLLYACSAAAFVRYAAAMLVMLIQCGIVFVCYPTVIVRPDPPSGGIAGRLLALTYRIDGKAANCLPSIHCAASLCFLIGALGCDAMPVWLKTAVSLLSLLICCSTVLVKQHAIVDVAAAIPVTGVAWAVAYGIDTAPLLRLLGLG